jgi:hypothetical protein
MRTTGSFVNVPGLALAMGVLLAETAVYADIGAGTLVVEQAPYDYDGDFFALQIGVAYIVLIEGVLPTEIGGLPAPETMPVWVKSSYFGNTMFTATQLHLLTYWFRYTPPARSAGSDFDACGAATVSYGNGHEGGYDARSLCFGPGWWCQSNPWVAMVRFVNADGARIPCPATGVERASWSSIKELYR